MSEQRYGYEIVRKGEKHVATVVYLDGQQPSTQQITGEHPSYREVTLGLHNEEPVEVVRELFNVALALQRKLHALTDRVAIRDQTLYFDGDELHGALAEQIVRHFREGADFGALVAFLELLHANPGKNENPDARENILSQSYRWISSARLDITDEGFIVGYKGVRRNSEDDAYNGDYRSTTGGHAFVENDGEIEEINGPVPQSIGTVVFMPRSEVAYDPSTSCSTGLHVGTRSYAKSYGNVTVRVIVDPRDIVSVPAGEDEKMRVSRYVVDGEEDRTYDTPSFAGPVYSSPYASDLFTPVPADETPAEAEDPEADEFTQGDGPNRAKAESIAARHGYRVVDYDNVVEGEIVLGQNPFGETLDIPPFTVRDADSKGFIEPRYIVIGLDTAEREEQAEEPGIGPKDDEANRLAQKYGFTVTEYRQPVSGEFVITQKADETLDEHPPWQVGGSAANWGDRYIVVKSEDISTPQEPEETPVDPNQTALDLGITCEPIEGITSESIEGITSGPVSRERFFGFTAGLPAAEDGRVIIDDEADEEYEDDIEPEYCEWCGDAECQENCVDCTQCGDSGCEDCEPEDEDEEFEPEEYDCGDPNCEYCG